MIRCRLQPKHLGVGLSERSATVMTCKQLQLLKKNQLLPGIVVLSSCPRALQHCHVGVPWCHAFLTFEDNRLANEMRLSESRPAKSGTWTFHLPIWKLQTLATCHTKCIYVCHICGAKPLFQSAGAPASSKVVSISIGPAISSTMLKSHPPRLRKLCKHKHKPNIDLLSTKFQPNLRKDLMTMTSIT